VALADRALTLMDTIMADLKLESLSPTAVCSLFHVERFITGVVLRTFCDVS